MKVEVSASSYDATIKDILHWYKEHCAFMAKEGVRQGMDKEKVVPARVFVTRYSCERLSAKIFVSIPIRYALPSLCLVPLSWDLVHICIQARLNPLSQEEV